MTVYIPSRVFKHYKWYSVICSWPPLFSNVSVPPRRNHSEHCLTTCVPKAPITLALMGVGWGGGVALTKVFGAWLSVILAHIRDGCPLSNKGSQHLPDQLCLLVLCKKYQVGCLVSGDYNGPPPPVEEMTPSHTHRHKIAISRVGKKSSIRTGDYPEKGKSPKDVETKFYITVCANGWKESFQMQVLEEVTGSHFRIANNWYPWYTSGLKHVHMLLQCAHFFFFRSSVNTPNNDQKVAYSSYNPETSWNPRALVNVTHAKVRWICISISYAIEWRYKLLLRLSPLASS